MYAIAIPLAVVSGLLFGVVPVRPGLAGRPVPGAEAGMTVTLGRRVSVRDLLLVVRVAICAVLVTASMVAVREMTRSLHADYGFDPNNVLLVSTDPTIAGYTSDQAATSQKRMVDAIRAVPGVSSAALVSPPPLDQAWRSIPILTDEIVDLSPSKAACRSMQLAISPEYLHTEGTALLSGRNITEHDNKEAPRVAVVNREFGCRMFGRSPAVGGHFKLNKGRRPAGRVISVARRSHWASWRCWERCWR